MEKSSLKITTKAQFERLVQLMEHNPEIARGKPKFGMTKNQCKDLWEGFALELNSIGPPTRTSSEWQRVWIHYKASVKKKLANNKQNMQATGGGPSQEIPLNSLEDCVSQLLRLNQQVAPSGQIFGAENVPPTTSNAPDESIEATRENEIPSNIPTRRRNRNCPENERLTLLREQAATQATVLKAINKLEKTVYKNYEINKQLLKIKEKKMALYERSVKEATELHSLKTESEKLKIEKLKNEMNL